MSTRSRILLALLALIIGPLLGVGIWACVLALRTSPSAVSLIFAAVFIAAAAAGAFVILIGDLLRSLDVLSSAAVRIGQGDFSPWLPPPTHDEVGRLSFAIGTMATRLEQVMRQNARTRQMAAIGELASHVSHEIRNPLSSIKLNLQSVEREMRGGAVPTDLPDVLQLCLREIHRLDGTVQGVLRLAGSREPHLGPCSLHALLEDAMQTVGPQLEERAIHVATALDAPRNVVRADSAQLRGVLLNLLLNARDAMPDGGRLTIWTEMVEDSTHTRMIRVHIADEGPGVPPEDRDRIFQPFFTTKSTGSGIGLPLASRTIEAHGGRLYLERRSELERGAEFVFELPLGESTDASPQQGLGGSDGKRHLQLEGAETSQAAKKTSRPGRAAGNWRGTQHPTHDNSAEVTG
jgi:signal transduction histidine kinase